MQLVFVTYALLLLFNIDQESVECNAEYRLMENHEDMSLRDKPGFYLVISNISKRCNVRSLIASAVAFGAEVLVGERNEFRCSGIGSF